MVIQIEKIIKALDAMIYTCAPYLDYSKEYVQDNYPWIVDLVEAYNEFYLEVEEYLPNYKEMSYAN